MTSKDELRAKIISDLRAAEADKHTFNGDMDKWLGITADSILNLLEGEKQKLLDKVQTEVLDEYCPQSERVDGKRHSWKFDGDDPNIICHYCGEVRRSGVIVVPGRTTADKLQLQMRLATLNKEPNKGEDVDE